MISILVPIYNGIEFLDECIDSILQQTFKEYEIIIGVNGWEENSHVFKTAFNKKSNNIFVFDLHYIKGKSNALNEMIKFSNFDWISVLDVDDIWLPGKLNSQIEFTNNYDVIGTQCKYFGDMNAVPTLPLGDDINNFNFLNYNPIINSSCLLKKELCLWDPIHDGVEDYDLWLKLWKNKKKFYNVPSIQVLHRVHHTSQFNYGNHEKGIKMKSKYTNN